MYLSNHSFNLCLNQESRVILGILLQAKEVNIFICF